jgi:hypothetical protein
MKQSVSLTFIMNCAYFYILERDVDNCGVRLKIGIKFCALVHPHVWPIPDAAEAAQCCVAFGLDWIVFVKK